MKEIEVPPQHLISALITSIEGLIETTGQTNENVKDLTESVNELIVDRAVQVERDVAQHKFNDFIREEIHEITTKQDVFIEKHNQNLYRLDNWYKMQNKVIIAVVTIAILAIGRLLGFDWKG